MMQLTTVIELLSLGLFVGVILFFLANTNSAFMQDSGLTNEVDPREAEIPVSVSDFKATNKSIVVLLKFVGQDQVEFVSGNVTFGFAATHIGDPPMLFVEIFDAAGNRIRQFNSWHPLVSFSYDEDTRSESLVMLPNVVGSFIFPFDRDAALMEITDFKSKATLISVDLRPIIRMFCEGLPTDPDCQTSDLSIEGITLTNNTLQLPLAVSNQFSVRVVTTNNGQDAPVDAVTNITAVIRANNTSGMFNNSSTVPSANNTGASAVETLALTPIEVQFYNQIAMAQGQQYPIDQEYRIACFEPGTYGVTFLTKIAAISPTVIDPNQTNNIGESSVTIDCGIDRESADMPLDSPAGEAIVVE